MHVYHENPPESNAPTDRPGTGSTLLSRCRELRQLGLSIAHPGTEEVDILSSITSARIRRVCLIGCGPVLNPTWHDINCNIFDEPLCRLADRLGRTRELKVDFTIMDVEDAEAEATVIANSLVKVSREGMD